MVRVLQQGRVAVQKEAHRCVCWGGRLGAQVGAGPGCFSPVAKAARAAGAEI